MKQHFFTKQQADIPFDVEVISVHFFLNQQMRLVKVLWSYNKEPRSYNGLNKYEFVNWGNENRNKWNFEEVNEEKLSRAFKELALKSPKEFKALYYTLKEHDDVTFPCIQATLKQIQEIFNFE